METEQTLVRVLSGVEERLLQLASRHLGTGLAELNLTRVTGDASTRSYYRAAAPGGESVILALYDKPFDDAESAGSRLARGGAGARLTFANDPCAHVETTDLFRDSGLPVPAILGVYGTDGVLVMEDVGDVRMQDWLATCTGSELVAAYKRALSMIVTIQECTPKIQTGDSICSRLAFDEAKLGWELDFFANNYFANYLGNDLNDDKAKMLREGFATLSAELSARPRVLVHRDYHTRNLMMCGGKMFIIDHQDARMGPSSYDVTSLLNDPYAPLDPGVKSELMDYFVEMKKTSPVPLPPGFDEEYELMTVQRTLKAVGTYAFQSSVKKNTVYVPYIKPALESAVRSMQFVGRFEGIRELLEQSLDLLHER